MSKKTWYIIGAIALIGIIVYGYNKGWFSGTMADCTACNYKTTDGSNNEGVIFNGRCTGTGNVSEACFLKAYPNRK